MLRSSRDKCRNVRHDMPQDVWCASARDHVQHVYGAIFTKLLRRHILRLDNNVGKDREDIPILGFDLYPGAADIDADYSFAPK